MTILIHDQGSNVLEAVEAKTPLPLNIKNNFLSDFEHKVRKLIQRLQANCNPQEQILLSSQLDNEKIAQLQKNPQTFYLTWTFPIKSLKALDLAEMECQEASHTLRNLLCLTLIPQNSGPVYIDFLTGKKAHRRHFGGGMGQPLVRAMGKIDNRLPTILDATAGMGGDSFVLASLGFKVQMLERDCIVASLLEDALQRARQAKNVDAQLESAIEKLSIIAADSTEYLSDESNGNSQPIETIYLDPMYPEKKKSAATKKEMAALQKRVGPDLDSQQLLEVAIKSASYRVVVKRPKGAPVIHHPKYLPTTDIKSPNTRYDIYVIKALKSP